MKFLIVKTSSAGDIIQAFPVLEYIKKFFPKATVDWVVEREYQALIQSHPLVRKGIIFSSRFLKKLGFHYLEWKGVAQSLKQLRLEKYDFLFDLQGNIKSSFITGAARANKKVGLGWKSVAEFPNFFVIQRHINIEDSAQIQEKYLQLIQKFFEDRHPFLPKGIKLKLTLEEEQLLKKMLIFHKKRYMVACFSKWSNKQLGEDHLKAVLKRIDHEDSPYFYFIWRGESEKIIADRLHRSFPESQSVGDLSFPLWQALMGEMDLVVTVDSAALALCGTTKTPSLSFFGPSLARVYRPLGENHVSCQGGCPYGYQFDSRCPILRRCQTGACLKEIEIDQLFEAYIKIKSKILSLNLTR